MSVVMMIDNPNGSQEIYQRASSGMTLPLGGSVHLAGPGPEGGRRVIEVWAGEAEARHFLRDELAPALRGAGAQGPPRSPQFWPLYRCAMTGVPA